MGGFKIPSHFWYHQNVPNSGSLTLVYMDSLMFLELRPWISALHILSKCSLLWEMSIILKGYLKFRELIYFRIYNKHLLTSVYFFAFFPCSILQATVHVLPEVNLPSHPEGALWSCYHKFGCQATIAGSLEKPYQVSSGKNRLGKTRNRKVSFSSEVRCLMNL